MKYFPHVTNRRTDGRTDVTYDNHLYLFLEKRKTAKNTSMNTVCQLLCMSFKVSPINLPFK